MPDFIYMFIACFLLFLASLFSLTGLQKIDIWNKYEMYETKKQENAPTLLLNDSHASLHTYIISLPTNDIRAFHYSPFNYSICLVAVY